MPGEIRREERDSAALARMAEDLSVKLASMGDGSQPPHD